MLATLKGASEFVEVGVKFLLQDGLKEKSLMLENNIKHYSVCLVFAISKSLKNEFWIIFLLFCFI